MRAAGPFVALEGVGIEFEQLKASATCGTDNRMRSNTQIEEPAPGGSSREAVRSQDERHLRRRTRQHHRAGVRGSIVDTSAQPFLVPLGRRYDPNCPSVSSRLC